jgi:hypothetical protein
MLEVFERETRMRITLTIDDDLLSAAKELAARQRKTVGEVISSLARQGCGLRCQLRTNATVSRSCPCVGVVSAIRWNW